jgi:streptogrisin C
MLTVDLFIRCAIAALVAATAPLTALAQDSDVRTPTPPDPSVTAPTSAKQASISYLSRRYSISAQEAERRLSLQGEVAQLRDRLAASLGSDLGRIRIQHAGEYRVIVETLNPARTTSQLDGVSTELRAAIQVVEVRRSGQDVSARVDELATLLKTGGVAARLGFDPLTDKFEVTVADEAALLRARALVPAAMLTDVVMAVGLMPRDAQAGYVSGDYTYGGWLLYHTSSDSPLCTTGFVVRLSDARATA